MENTIELLEKGKNLFSRLRSFIGEKLFLEIERNYLFIVETTEPFEGYDPGQLIYVQRESTQDYTGVFLGDRYATVPKNICKRLEE